MASVNGLRHFSDSEFPRGVLPYMDPSFLPAVDDWRHRLGQLNNQTRVKPSPLKDGWVRFMGSETSRHYAKGRLSDAGDLFLFYCDFRLAWMEAMSGPFGGIGIYYDTTWNNEPRIMFHLDMRPERVIWARANDEYIYPERSFQERRRFFDLLAMQEPWKWNG